MLERRGERNGEKEEGSETYVHGLSDLEEAKATRSIGKKTTDDSVVPDVEEEPISEDEEINETTFTFDAFEQVCKDLPTTKFLK